MQNTAAATTRQPPTAMATATAFGVFFGEGSHGAGYGSVPPFCPGTGGGPKTPAGIGGWPPGRPGDDGGGKVPEGAVGSAEDDAPPNGGGPPGCLGDDGGSCRSVTIPSFVSRCGFFVLQACLSGYPIRAPAAMGGVWRAGTEGRAGAGGPKTKSPP